MKNPEGRKVIAQLSIDEDGCLMSQLYIAEPNMPIDELPWGVVFAKALSHAVTIEASSREGISPIPDAAIQALIRRALLADFEKEWAEFEGQSKKVGEA